MRSPRRLDWGVPQPGPRNRSSRPIIALIVASEVSAETLALLCICSRSYNHMNHCVDPKLPQCLGCRLRKAGTTRGVVGLPMKGAALGRRRTVCSVADYTRT